MLLKIVVLDGGTMNPGDLDWTPLAKLGELEVFPRTKDKQFFERAQKADILIVNKVILNRSRLEKLPDLKYIIVSATGFNNIDIPSCKELKIPVSNVRSYSSSSVAQHVFANILSYLHQSFSYHKKIRTGEWSRHLDWSYWYSPILELKDKKFGIYGYGEIGKQVAKIAKAFDMDILIHTRSPGKNLYRLRFVGLEELFSASDYISLHAPQSAENQEFVNRELLKKMKPDAILVNTARGGLINENDLYRALKNNWLKAAFLDVLQAEPPPDDHPLFNLDNCFITPHLAWGSRESRQRLLDGVLANLSGFINGVVINQVY